MKALILAAGKGTRFKRDSKGPKALVKFYDKTLIEYIIKSLAYNNIEMSDIALVTGFESQYLNNLLVKKYSNHFYDTSNMLMSIYCALDYFDGKQDVIISYSDIIFEPRVLESLLNTKGDFVVVGDRNWKKLWQIRMENFLDDIETFVVDNEDNLVEIGGKVKNIKCEVMGQYIGLLKIGANYQNIFRNNLTSFFSGNHSIEKTAGFSMSVTEYLQALIYQKQKIKICWIENGWLEFDSNSDKEAYLLAETKPTEKLLFNRLCF